MICVLDAPALASWLRQAPIFARRGDRLLLCAPYVEPRVLTALGIASAPNVGVFTGDASAGPLRATLRRADATVSVVQHLHAKVYALCTPEQERTEVVVTSANLTSSGLSRNRELGILARGDTPQGLRIVREVERFLAGCTPFRRFP